MRGTDSKVKSGLSFPEILKPRNASALYLLVIVLVVFGLWIPGLFYSQATFRLVLSGQVAVGMLAIAILIPFTAGVFDLSVGSMLAFSLVIVSWLGVHSGMNGILRSVIAVAACAVIGFFSGLVTVKFRVNSFIATLGMSQVLAAITLFISANQQIVGAFGPTFQNLAQGNWLGIPRATYYLAGLAIITWYVTEWTPLGRNMFAVGSNTEAARLAGIHTDRIVIGSLVASAVVAGLAGVVYGAQVATFSNSYGTPLLFPAFAALFFGSTQFKGRANVWGSMLAVYVLAFGVEGVTLKYEQASYWLGPFFDGVSLLIAVAYASSRGVISIRKRSNELAKTEEPPIPELPFLNESEVDSGAGISAS
ncbi:MAG: ABC transporter permease [Acidimicrobiales bacterium]